MTTYRIVRIRDPRTPGFFWFEIEGRSTSGETFTAAVCDTRQEARQAIKAMREAKAGIDCMRQDFLRHPATRKHGGCCR